MISHNLRHFRVFLAVAELRSLTLASERCRVSQPAVTQSLGKLERETGQALFERTRQGFFLTGRGEVFEARIRRAMQRLDAAPAEVSPRLTVTVTTPQLQALIAMTEAQNFTLAARMLGLAQPTVHRAITRVEQEAARPLFERTSFGMVATRPCRALAQAARLAFSEFEQAEADLAEFDGREVGRIVVG
jgi:LysR family transcriptional regulator of gallate degradation